MSTSGTTQVVELDDDHIERYTVSPQDVGLGSARPEDLAGGTPAANADTARRILAGEHGPQRDLALMNAGAAIYAAGRAEDLRDGVDAAARAVDSGAAAERARALRRPHEGARARERPGPASSRPRARRSIAAGARCRSPTSSAASPLATARTGPSPRRWRARASR